MSSPAPPQHNIVLPIKEVLRILRIQPTLLEPLLPLQRTLRPLPHTPRLPSPQQPLGANGRGVPMTECDICGGEVRE